VPRQAGVSVELDPEPLDFLGLGVEGVDPHDTRTPEGGVTGVTAATEADFRPPQESAPDAAVTGVTAVTPPTGGSSLIREVGGVESPWIHRLVRTGQRMKAQARALLPRAFQMTPMGRIRGLTRPRPADRRWKKVDRRVNLSGRLPRPRPLR
jgi:hypothetical protein